MFVYSKFFVILLVTKTASSNNFEPFSKCCDDESVLNDRLECTKTFQKNPSNETILTALFNATNDNGTMYTICFQNGDTGKIITNKARRNVNNEICMDNLPNGTRVKLFCNSEIIVLNDTLQQCGSWFTQLHFWGATMVIFATVIYNVPFIIVVIIYCSLPELRYRAYDRAVFNYNLCYMMINFLLIILGFCTLCNTTMSATTYRLFGLGIMFWTQGAVIWLFIICFDMTLVITRFRWAPKGGTERGREEKRKCLIYGAWGWGLSALLAFIPAIVEFSPIFPENSPIRPNFHKFDETNVAVIVYVITGPILICLTNTCLFIYTTAKTIAVQKSTAIIHENRKHNVKKRYFVFLKLYLLMDTPWLTGALGAIYTDLWILKFMKMIQPILIIILIVPRKRVLAAISCFKGEVDERRTVRLNKEPQNKVNHRTTKKIDPTMNC